LQIRAHRSIKNDDTLANKIEKRTTHGSNLRKKLSAAPAAASVRAKRIVGFFPCTDATQQHHRPVERCERSDVGRASSITVLSMAGDAHATDIVRAALSDRPIGCRILIYRILSHRKGLP
jgi:hypothetical protein